MNKKIINYIPLVVLLLGLVSLGFKGEDKAKSVNKTTTNDNYNYIAINQIFMWVSNNGDGSHDPRTDAQGFYWPGGINATKGAIFEDGLVWGGKIGREVRVGGSTYRHSLEAGPILDDGTAADPGDSKYRIYKIRKDWESLPPGPEKDQYQKDYNEWPGDEGAPYIDVDGDGIYTAGVDQPQFIGDEVLWCVSNDLDASKTTNLYGTLPLGLEQQMTVFGFNRTGSLGDMVFKKYTLINKGSNTIKDMTVGYWSDTDLGDAADDFTGCDTSLSLGYTYNGSATDDIYNDGAPPAIGYDFFQGPIVEGTAADSAKFLGTWKHGYKNLPMTAFTFYINEAGTIYQDPELGTPQGAIQMYNYLTGYLWNGTPFVDPNTGEEVKIILAGDPVEGTGWYEGDGWPGGPKPNDRRHLMGSGPFTMAPGDTQEVVVGIVIARGADNINSITALKQKDGAAQIAYNLDFKLTPPPPAPVTHAAPADQQVTLWWEPNAESYNELDPILPDTIRLNVSGQEYVIPVPDKNFKFEGYRVWQYKDLTGTDPKLLGVYDIKDSVKDIRNFSYNYITINGGNISQEPIIAGNDAGLQRNITITKDAYTNGPLYNGNPYYFAVTAYGYSKYSDPPVLESSPVILEVRPGTPAVDVVDQYNQGDNFSLEQTAGKKNTAKVQFKIVDPSALTGHQYNVVFYGDTVDLAKPGDSLSYSLIDKTTGDTLLKNRTDFVTLSQDEVTKAYYVAANDTAGKPVIDGFMLLVQDVLRDSLTIHGDQKYYVKGVYEVKGPGGTPIENPINVLGHLNSTKEWSIKAKGGLSRLNWQSGTLKEGIGYDDYELRFTGTSPFYASGYAFSFVPVTKDDTVGEGTVPFEAWDIGRKIDSPDDDYRLTIKVLDFSRTDPSIAIPDHKYSQLPNNDWEQIFAYNSDFPADNIPTTSGTSKDTAHKFGALSISATGPGILPADGTVLRIETLKPLVPGDVFTGVPKAPVQNSAEAAKNNLDKISVFPNPYFGANSLERDKYQRFVRFTNLPNKITIRIFSIAGVFINSLQKEDSNQYLDWNLRNSDGLPIASGIYLAYLDMPGIGTKIMKIAVIMEQQYIDRL